MNAAVKAASVAVLVFLHNEILTGNVYYGVLLGFLATITTII
jgi:hypothetical protein